METQEALDAHYGHWEVLDRADHRAKVNVRCTLCDTVHQVQRTKLLDGFTRSCRRCSPRKRGPGIGKTWDTDELAPAHAPEVTPGAQFGRLTVTSDTQPSHKHGARCQPDCDIPRTSEPTVRCRCECGNTVQNVPTRRLRDRTTRSCGCLKRDAGRALHA